VERPTFAVDRILFLQETVDPPVQEIVLGAMLLAGNSQAQAVVRVVAVDDDGQAHFSILPGSVAKNRHLLGRTVA